MTGKEGTKKRKDGSEWEGNGRGEEEEKKKTVPEREREGGKRGKKRE